MDYTAMATVHQAVRYHVEGLDPESGWTRVQPDEGNEFHDGADDGFHCEVNAIAYAANVREFTGGAKVRVVEEITMRASRVAMEQ